MKNILLPILLASCLFLIILVGAGPIFNRVARMGYIKWDGRGYTSPQARQFLQQRRMFMERTNTRLGTLIGEGEYARRDGDLRAAEQAFKAIIISPEALQYPNERLVQDYVLKAKAELAKVQAQEAVIAKAQVSNKHPSEAVR